MSERFWKFFGHKTVVTIGSGDFEETVDIDELYNEFKERLMRELVAKPADAMFNPGSGQYEPHLPLIERK